jgi:general stress protein YciG
MAHDNANAGAHSGESRTTDARQNASKPEENESSRQKSNRGFASMDPAKQREIASKGGRAAHEKGTAHQFSANEAREAGKKGGGTVSQDRHHMAEIGRIGGQARGRKQRANAQQAGQAATPEAGSDDAKEGDTTASRPSSEYHH